MEPQEDKEFLKEAFHRFKLCEEAEADIRREALEDFKFLDGDQWPDDIKKKREEKKQPCLTINRLPAFKQMITNEQRQQKPSTQVNPVGDGSDDDTAEIIQGVIRHIEVLSDAEIAYDTAFDHLVTGGFGHWRYNTEYLPGSFDQEIKVLWLPNPFCVYTDPFCLQPDRSDANYRFIIEDLSPETYKSQFPDSALAKIDNQFSSIGNIPAGWVTKEGRRVAEYFYVAQEKKTLYLLPDGRTSDKLPEGTKPIDQREEIVRKVKWAKINGIEVLDRTDWPGKYIPVVTVTGPESRIDGKLKVKGLIRDARDPQRNYNYWNSAATQIIALAPKSPYIAAAGQVENYKDMWDKANEEAFSTLIYDAVDIGGTPVPPPQRNVYEPPIAAITQMIRQADNDLKAVTNIYDASLGQRGPDESGKAILARQKQTDISTLHFSDNMARGIRFGGRILIDLIPKVYERDRIQRIVNPDGSTKMVRITNSATPQHPAEETSQEQQGESIQ